MNVRQLHHLWTKVRPVEPGYFFIAAGLFLVLGVFGLRANYMHMDELRNAVYEADKNNGDTSAALTNLQRYVTAHMNTKLAADNGVYPPIQLQYTYERLRETNAKASNEQVYADAQAHCEAQNSSDFSGRNRVPCIEEYVESHGVQQKTIPDAMYKFDFISPTWSPDFAGISLLLAGLSSVVGASWWALRGWIKRRV